MRGLVMQAFADWLDVTYSPIDNPRAELRLFLGGLGYTCADYTTSRERWSHDDTYGCLFSELKEGSHARLSASGSILDHLRSIGQFENYLSLLSLSPYRITRLDGAVDFLKDAAPILKRLASRFPRDISLGRQRSLRTQFLFSTRIDGLLSGTMYSGHRSKARVTARVYDKSLEALEKRNLILPPTTRCELTFREGIATLRDALDPTSIFWSHAFNLFTAPAGLVPWVEGAADDYCWSYSRPEVLPAVALDKRVAFSSEIAMMIELADKLGAEGRNHLMHKLCQRLGVEHKGTYFSRTG